MGKHYQRSAYLVFMHKKQTSGTVGPLLLLFTIKDLIKKIWYQKNKSGTTGFGVKFNNFPRATNADIRESLVQIAK